MLKGKAKCGKWEAKCVEWKWRKMCKLNQLSEKNKCQLGKKNVGSIKNWKRVCNA